MPSRIEIIDETVIISDGDLSYSKEILGLGSAHEVALTETSQNIIGLVRRVDEVITLAGDSPLRLVGFLDEINEAVNLNDSQDARLDLNRQINEQVSVNEAIWRDQPSRIEIIDETVIISDGDLSYSKEILGLGSAYQITITETADEFRSAPENIPPQLVNEAVALSESVDGRAGYAKTLNEAVALSESVDGRAGYAKTVNEAVALSESVDGRTGYVKTINEAVALSDVYYFVGPPQPLFKVAPTETIAIQEPENFTIRFSRVLAEAQVETISLGEQVEDPIVVSAISKQPIENDVAIAEQTQSTKGIVRSVDETVSITSQPARFRDLIRGADESITVSDAFLRVRALSQTIDEIIALVDSKIYSGPVTSRLETIDESVAITESVEAPDIARSWFYQLDELVSINESADDVIENAQTQMADIWAKLNLLVKVLRNRMEVNPVTGEFTIYDDDNSELLMAMAYEDASKRKLYSGKTINARNRLELQKALETNETATLSEIEGMVNLLYQHLINENRTYTGRQVIYDNNGNELYSADIWSNVAGTKEYKGKTLNRRDKFS